MDPDSNIAAQRAVIARLRADPSDQDARNYLAELTQALRDWLRAAASFPPHRTGSRSSPQATRCFTTDQSAHTQMPGLGDARPPARPTTSPAPVTSENKESDMPKATSAPVGAPRPRTLQFRSATDGHRVIYHEPICPACGSFDITEA